MLRTLLPKFWFLVILFKAKKIHFYFHFLPLGLYPYLPQSHASTSSIHISFLGKKKSAQTLLLQETHSWADMGIRHEIIPLRSKMYWLVSSKLFMNSYLLSDRLLWRVLLMQLSSGLVHIQHSGPGGILMGALWEIDNLLVFATKLASITVPVSSWKQPMSTSGLSWAHRSEISLELCHLLI